MPKPLKIGFSIRLTKSTKGFTFFRRKKAEPLLKFILSSKYNSGFTLIELLVSIAILLIITSVVIFSLRTFGQQVEIESISQNMMSTLRLARSRTLASEAETTYGVHFETTKYVLFAGTSYVDGAAGNKEFTLIDSEIYNISLNGGGSDVIFTRIRGTTSQYGSISARLVTDNSQTRTINISSSGQMSLQETVATTDSRIIDSRHLHFDLGWSIQNSTTLRLNFPNDSVTQNIAMSGFFNLGKTEFDWSGKIPVGGTDQVLRIHTHSLDSFNTNLSIHRDRRYNDKALTVSIIDSGVTKAIVSYDANGTASVGAYVQGSNGMTVQ